MTEFPKIEGKSSTAYLTEAVNNHTKAIYSTTAAINALNFHLKMMGQRVTRAERKVGLWVFAGGGYITGIAGIVLAVVK